MSDLITTIPLIRESVAAILRIKTIKPQTVKKGKVAPGKYQLSFGSAFCIVTDRYLLTANHVVKARTPQEHFYAFIVPQNNNPAYHFPIVAFPIERPDIDIAVLEIGPCKKPGVHLPSIPLSFSQQNDGSRVLTIGYAAPLVSKINVDEQGNFNQGEFFLKSSANEGIVSAQYILENTLLYELNVGWHHGESGGPIVTLTDPPSAFSIMQSYRNIQSPHGFVAGPHRGVALSAIQKELTDLGVTIDQS